MMSLNDFKYKQIIVANLRDGEKVKVDDDCLSINDPDGKTKVKASFYRIFVVYLIGNFSITTNFIEKSKKYGFSIVIMSYSFRFITCINNGLDGNYLLHKKQYEYNSLKAGKELIKNKLFSQITNLKKLRQKNANDLVQEINECIAAIDDIDDYRILLSIEGMMAKKYFRILFEDNDWKGRFPRTKINPINTSLDIGYSLLFNFMDSISKSFDFDAYVGILHKEFYKRKSLICDLVEPFRYLVDYRTKKAFNNREFSIKDFKNTNGCYYLDRQQNSKYVSIYVTEILNHKEEMFRFVQSYYRWFMKGNDAKEFPKVNYGIDC